MKQKYLIEDLQAVLNLIIQNPGKAHEILTRIIQELQRERVTT